MGCVDILFLIRKKFKMSTGNFLRRMKVPLPEKLRGLPQFRSYRTLRFVVIYEKIKYDESSRIKNNPFVGEIQIYFVPNGDRNGGILGYPLAASVPFESDTNKDFVDEARKIANDESRLVRLLMREA